MGAVRESSVDGIARMGVEGVLRAPFADIVVVGGQDTTHDELTTWLNASARLASRGWVFPVRQPPELLDAESACLNVRSSSSSSSCMYNGNIQVNALAIEKR